MVRRGLSAEPLEPQLQKVIVDGITLGGAADKILVCQYVEGCLDTAGTWKVVLLDKLVAHRASHTVLLGNGLE